MDLEEALSVLNEMQAAGVIGSYAIAGAVAALYYIEPTVTEDLDVLLAFDTVEGQARSGLVTLQPVLSYLKNRGYSTFKSEGIEIGKWPVQFLPVASALDADALGSATLIEIEKPGSIDRIATRVLRPEHLVATALRVGRPKDYVRIAQFLQEAAVDLPRLKALLITHGLDRKWVTFCARAGLDDPLGLSKDA